MDHAADRFSQYEEAFLDCSRVISRSLIPLESLDGNIDAYIAVSIDIEGELSEADGYLRAMDIEFRTMSSIAKRSTQQKVNDYKEELKDLHRQFWDAKAKKESAFLRGDSGHSRNKLLTTNEKLDQSTATLEQTRIILAQTDNIGTSIILDLENQKEKITASKETVKETKDFTLEAKRVLKMISRKAIYHKIGVGVLIIVLLGAIIGVGYEGFYKK
jgi:vesicle transport through interaction with t-SNAREs protein 1